MNRVHTFGALGVVLLSWSESALKFLRYTHYCIIVPQLLTLVTMRFLITVNCVHFQCKHTPMSRG